ncbi:carbamoyl phosphate synthase-like protein [Maioricimonas rarisocia]|uniref:Carbamoyl phosphate synthase-like protein n=1 Tax=Maioricimonas rarisocia TaxID=2528026 RepID=A0A517ZCE8_9PLAN|nr:ATP-grasp domain-containing protein [Maioricimonas rarisocia]QDU40129.1 carbamoyl phosphate synthase-like protein [Maioricimonas rarisocia]
MISAGTGMETTTLVDRADCVSVPGHAASSGSVASQCLSPRRGEVLLLGDDTRTMLPVIRSLGRKGVAVDAAWVSDRSPIRSSRYLRTVHELPRLDEGPECWVPALEALVHCSSYELVIPVTEPALFALQEQRHRLETGVRLGMIDSDVFIATSDKGMMQRIAERAGIPTPRSWSVDSMAQLDAALAQQNGPVVVKPTCSIAIDDSPLKHFVQIFDDRSECRFAARTMLDRFESIVLQEYVAGRGCGVEFLARNGEMLVTFQHRRLHETSGHGSTYREGQVPSPELANATQRLLRAVNYTGVGMCEFRVDDETGRWVFVELNPRFWGSLPLAAASGVDFPWYLYQLLTEGRTDFDCQPRSGLRSRNLSADLRWMWRALIRRGTGASAVHEQTCGWRLNEVSGGRLLCDAMRLLLWRDSIDSFARDDWRPFVRELLRLCQRRLPAIAQRTR